MIKTFRGKVADGGQDTIVLHTNDGSTGYRIVKFESLPSAPGTDNFEAVVKIHSIKQTAFTGTIDFNDQTLLGAIFYTSYATGGANTDVVIFDNMVFNQDIYVTYSESGSGASDEAMNYYIELEQVKLDINSNTVATLKDMRNTASPRP